MLLKDCAVALIFVVKTFDATPKSGQDTITLLTVEPTALNVNVI
jgi:hypothetical protein